MNLLKNFKILLFLIIVLGVFLRFYNLNTIPSGFDGDEAAFGYNAYSILLTGKDEYATSFPLILKSFDDYKGAVYSYLAIPAVYIFGLTEFAVRLPTAILGLLLIPLSYLIVLNLTGNRRLSLITSFLVSINPLSIFLSRVQSDPLVSVSFVLLGFYCFLLWKDKNKIYLLLFSAFFWIASIFTYPSPRALLPVLFLGILIFYFKKLTLSRKKVLILILLIVTIIDFSVITGASQRLKQLSIFNAPVVTLPMEESIREDQGGNVIVTRAFHNKVTNHFLVVSKNYFDYLSYDFLFLKGGQPEREQIPGMGILYIAELPFLLYGAYLAFKNKERWGKMVIFLVLLFPLALSFAVDESPNVHRFYINILFLELLVALGILGFLNNLKKHSIFYKPIIILLILFSAFNLFYFIHQLFIHQPLHQPWYRGYAYKELILELSKIDTNYKKVIFTKRHASPYIYVLFFKKYDPSRYQKIGSPRDLDNTGFDNYIFVPKDCPLISNVDKKGNMVVQGEKGFLYINSGDCPELEKDVKLIKTIYWKDNNPAFKIIEYIGK